MSRVESWDLTVKRNLLEFKPKIERFAGKWNLFKICYILQFRRDKVSSKMVLFLRSGNFDDKYALCSGRLITKKVS